MILESILLNAFLEKAKNLDSSIQFKLTAYKPKKNYSESLKTQVFAIFWLLFLEHFEVLGQLFFRKTRTFLIEASV